MKVKIKTYYFVLCTVLLSTTEQPLSKSFQNLVRLAKVKRKVVGWGGIVCGVHPKTCTLRSPGLALRTKDKDVICPNKGGWVLTIKETFAHSSSSKKRCFTGNCYFYVSCLTRIRLVWQSRSQNICSFDHKTAYYCFFWQILETTTLH